MKKKQAKKVVSKKLESKSVPKYISSNNSQAAMIVKIISILEYIGAAFCIFFGLILLFGGQFILGMIPAAELSQIPAALISAALIFIAILMVVVGIFVIFLARALRNHKKWARIVTIIFSAISVLAALLSFPHGIIGLILHGAVIYFLGFDKNVIALFK